MRYDLEWVLTELTMTLLDTLNLDTESSFSATTINPRKQTGTTWVSIDTHKTNIFPSIDTTTAEHAALYFSSIDKDINNYMWMGVYLLEDEEGDICYELDIEGKALANRSQGFIFLTMQQVVDLFNDSKEITSANTMNAVKERVVKLFTTEVDCYAAWLKKDIHDIKVFNKDNPDFSRVARNIFNISNRVDSTVNMLIDELKKDISNQDGLMTMHINLNHAKLKNTAALLPELIGMIKDVSGINLTIGDFTGDKENKTITVSFLNQNLPNFSEIRKSSSDDLLQKMLDAMDSLTKNHNFSHASSWQMASYLIKDEPFSAWPLLLQTALFKTIIDSEFFEFVKFS